MACSVSAAAAHKIFQRPEMATTPPPPPEPEASDYDWIADLGVGGFAKVTKVRHRRTGDVFALKEAFNLSPNAEEEAEVLRRAAGSPSPFVVHCHAVFLGDGGGLASVHELMEAGTLFDVYCRSGAQGFPEPVLAELAARCLTGLNHLHTLGIAHLDVKPDNFLVNSRGDVKIGDFNTSRIVTGRAGESLHVATNMGTVSYYSPERFGPNEQADSRTAMAADVWGLGLTILDLFLGSPAIYPEVEKPTLRDWKKAICDRKPPRVPKDAEASAELRDFVAVCLQKDPTQRATVPELLEHPFVSHRDVAASSRALRELVVKNL